MRVPGENLRTVKSDKSGWRKHEPTTAPERSVTRISPWTAALHKSLLKCKQTVCYTKPPRSLWHSTQSFFCVFHTILSNKLAIGFSFKVSKFGYCHFLDHPRRQHIIKGCLWQQQFTALNGQK